MNIPQKHYLETKNLLKKISKDKIAAWLLEEGYYPEQYVLPPSFSIKQFELKKHPFVKVDSSEKDQKFDPEKQELVSISYPKTELTDRTFSIISPKIYHDIVWYLIDEWDFIIKSLFRKGNKIYSYSFPIPVNKNNEGKLGKLRAGRMIYEFLEMAENDLVSEAHNYKYILKTDIKNFYPSIYTHSIAWALHSKKIIRKSGNRSDYSNFLGLKLDRLFQYANDGCTNGIAIGPAISDLISEILLSAVDYDSSVSIKNKNIDFIGVRFKDDYRFLCQSKENATQIIKILQKKMQFFNLTLNEEKSEIEELPEGMFREWTAEYHTFSLRYNNNITYKKFENSLRGTLKVDKKYDGTGVVDRFLSELTDNKNELKLEIKEKDIHKILSLLLLLKERRNKSFPHILGIIEKIYYRYENKKRISAKIKTVIKDTLDEKLDNIEDLIYDIIWLVYFIKSNNFFKINYPSKIKSVLIKSIRSNNQQFFKSMPTDIKMFNTIKKVGKNKDLLDHLSVFKKPE